MKLKLKVSLLHPYPHGLGFQSNTLFSYKSLMKLCQQLAHHWTLNASSTINIWRWTTVGPIQFTQQRQYNQIVRLGHLWAAIWGSSAYGGTRPTIFKIHETKKYLWNKWYCVSLYFKGKKMSLFPIINICKKKKYVSVPWIFSK